MKTLTCILTVVLLLSAAPSSSEKKAPPVSGNVTLRAWFYHASSGAFIDICALPIWMPRAYVWGDTTVNINCPSSSVVVYVTEGQTVSCSVALNLKTNVLASYPYVVDADNIGAGSVDLIVPM
ncbi:hypothetical protein [Chitinophaga varians]|uniref:hypothetical protein n=1 Tax=Chitinophaga varians TaxID=2202339 RepID=UPI00165F42F4|nr:hypothetical protein [Chitinophaga varians]MBC9909460.1 hypothetical protein [Chitinophaga varians]